MRCGTQVRAAATRLQLLGGLSVFALAGCGGEGPETSDAAMPIVSENPTLQAAFRACVEQTSAEFAADNPEIQAEILQMLAVGALQTCESAVIRTCEQGLERPACRVILDVYSR